MYFILHLTKTKVKRYVHSVKLLAYLKYMTE